jgi:polar amino acid transport system ATP-binding protein
MKINLANINHAYHGKAILQDISLNLEHAEAIAIIGPSGAGKSTLLRLMSKIENPDSGAIFVNDIDVVQTEAKDYYKKVGFVFQSHNLFPHLTALRNITLVLEKVHNKSPEEAKRLAVDLLTQFELIEHMNKKPIQLSGGQAQRVSIIRSLAINPEVMFLDEPTSALDPILTREVLRTILKLREKNMRFVIVTHELGFAKKVADYILFMEDGRIVEHGPISILDKPQTESLKEFVEFVME